MKNLFKVITLGLLFSIILTNCGSPSNEIEKEATAYETMELLFEGYPATSEIQPMLETVMTRFDVEITEENLKIYGGELYSRRKKSLVGVTEMEILKDVYQKGYTENTLEGEILLSYLYLESTK